MRGGALILLLFLLSSCKEDRKVAASAYYWKTIYRPTAYEQDRLHQLDCKNIYLRFFDVDRDGATGHPMPVSSIRLPEQMDTAYSYIPTVFITQKTLVGLEKEDIAPLAGNISSLIESICKNSGIAPKEIQIDCDWTYRTKQAYFSLLTELKRQLFFSGKKMSCTIRLFQVKYISKSGVPPVDRGMLMCYNMGNMRKPGVKNSILDYEEAVQYLHHIADYPLPLDIALPLFDWPLLFRNDQFKGILRDIEVAEAVNAPFLEKQKGNLFLCTRDTLWKGYYLQKGDKVCMENSEYDDIEKVAAYTANRIKNKELNVAFFHCDSVTLSKYSSHELEKIIDGYR